MVAGKQLENKQILISRPLWALLFPFTIAGYGPPSRRFKCAARGLQRPECAIFLAKSWYEDVLVPSDYPSIFARKAAHSGRSLCSLESPPRRICVLQHIMSKCLTPESPKIALMDHTLPLTMSVTFVTIRYTQLHGDWCRVSSTRTVREQFVCSCSFVHVRSR